MLTAEPMQPRSLSWKRTTERPTIWRLQRGSKPFTTTSTWKRWSPKISTHIVKSWWQASNIFRPWAKRHSHQSSSLTCWTTSGTWRKYWQVPMFSHSLRFWDKKTKNFLDMFDQRSEMVHQVPCKLIEWEEFLWASSRKLDHVISIWSTSLWELLCIK